MNKGLLFEVDNFSHWQNCNLPGGWRWAEGGKHTYCPLFPSAYTHRCQILEESNPEQKEVENGSGKAGTFIKMLNSDGEAGTCMLFHVSMSM